MGVHGERQPCNFREICKITSGSFALDSHIFYFSNDFPKSFPMLFLIVLFSYDIIVMLKTISCGKRVAVIPGSDFFALVTLTSVGVFLLGGEK